MSEEKIRNYLTWTVEYGFVLAWSGIPLLIEKLTSSNQVGIRRRRRSRRLTIALGNFGKRGQYP